MRLICTTLHASPFRIRSQARRFPSLSSAREALVHLWRRVGHALLCQKSGLEYDAVQQAQVRTRVQRALPVAGPWRSVAWILGLSDDIPQPLRCVGCECADMNRSRRRKTRLTGAMPENMVTERWTNRDQHEYGGPLSCLLIIQAKRRQDEGCERALSRMGLLNSCIAVDGTPCTALHTNDLMKKEEDPEIVISVPVELLSDP